MKDSYLHKQRDFSQEEVLGKDGGKTSMPKYSMLLNRTFHLQNFALTMGSIVILQYAARL